MERRNSLKPLERKLTRRSTSVQQKYIDPEDVLSEMFSKPPETFNKNKDNTWAKLGALDIKSMIKKGILFCVQGHAVKKTDEYYAGQVDQDNKRSGLGRFDCQSYVFEGQWDAHKFNGYGRLIYVTGESYDGTFLDNKFNG